MCHRNNQGIVVWFTGLSGSGKTAIASYIYAKLKKNNYKTYLLDGDILRDGLNNDLGFIAQDRRENIRRAGEVAKLFFQEGYLVLASFISPYKDIRANLKKIIGEKNFIEVYVKADIKTCMNRDVKGLYEKARKGEINDFTGVSDVYEVPVSSEIVLDTDKSSVKECGERVLEYLRMNNF